MSRNGQMIGILFSTPYGENFNNVSFHEMDGLIPDLNSHEWDSELETLKLMQNSKILTKLQFLDKFTINERIVITASDDPIVNDIMRMFNIADYINMDDSKTIQAIQYFMHANYITQDRYLEIMN